MSACLLGHRVRYDGRARTLEDGIVDRWLAEGRVVSVCPEVDSGMGVPRKPSEIVGGEGRDVLAGRAAVFDVDGGEVTSFFEQGARIALALCEQHDIKVAILTDASPSCGSSSIYDGSFSGTKAGGAGVTTALLRTHGIRVFSEREIVEASKAL